MLISRYKKTNGMSLIEVMIVLLIISLLAAGTFSCEFYAFRQAKQAKAQMIAIRTAQMLLEDWKANSGSAAYNPVSSVIDWTQEANGDYLASIDSLPIHFSLNSNDISYDEAAKITLRQITVTAKWRNDFSNQPLRDEDSSLVLTTYVRLDQAGG